MSTPRAVTPLAFPSDATLSMPGSKSDANRLLVAAALSGHPVTVTGASPSDDVRHLVAALATMGYGVRWLDETAGEVAVGPRRSDAPTTGTLFCGNAGTALRFSISVAAITPGEWTIDGDAHMRRRPIQPLVDAWRALGVDAEASNGCPPVRVRGGAPHGDSVRVDARISSQFVSSLLLVAARLPRGLRIDFGGELASRDYALWTAAVLRRFGVEAEVAADHASVRHGYGPAPQRIEVGGDWSSMGVWTCLDLLTGSRVQAPALQRDSGQPDEALGALLAKLRAGDERTLDVDPLPDQFLNLAVTAALVPGTTHLIGAANTRRKECDRVAVMARELRRCGVDLDEHEDGLTVRGGAAWRPTVIDPEADHRIAMAFALAGLCVPGITVGDPDCVAKSYPTFWDDLERVRAQHRPVVLIGMRAAGKTTLGRELAQRLGSTLCDTDEQFVARHGEIGAFVAANGWPAFRKEERQLVAATLQPGTIVATGGGAVEATATQQLLRERAFVVFVDAPLELLRARLAGSDRPSLTGAPVTDELDAVLARRLPIYRAMADRTVDASLALDAQVSLALRGEYGN
ncbi:MAG: 3-phosphoshikimate 1-carboxyvinyltransferase [Planctomycetes bacterium]|nr:3-phosphoshikimate 1-carboxyvinyltransferase [Planctomycetota bacterium]